jgi:hypothetical protein
MFGHLEPIWNGLGRSKYLVTWAFGQKVKEIMFDALGAGGYSFFCPNAKKTNI